MPEETKTRIPAPLYAAAGVGELAYRQLRKLPAVVTELRGKATTDLRHRAAVTRVDLRERAFATLQAANTTAAELRERARAAEVERLREAARRNANGVLAGAQAAQARATAAYQRLVAHGERVVGTGVVQAADTVTADMEATEAPAEVTATPTDVAAVTEQTTKAEVAQTAKDAPAKPAKRTRAATRN